MNSMSARGFKLLSQLIYNKRFCFCPILIVFVLKYLELLFVGACHFVVMLVFGK